MRASVQVGLAFLASAMTLMVLVVGAAGDVGVLVVLMLIALLVTRELTASQAPALLRARIGLFVFAGLLAFVYIVVQRVREILNL